MNMLTGCVGFIGSNLLDELMKREEDVLGYDVDRNRRWVLEKHSKYPLTPGFYTCENNNLKVIWDNIKNLNSYHYLYDNLDTIYHLAAASDIKKSKTEPWLDVETNINGTFKILEMMRKKDIKNIIFTSTSVVHGENAPKPTPEKGIDFDPISLYSASKVSAEMLIRAYSHTYGIKGWIFRFANVIGKNQRRGVIVDFFKKIKENPKELEILGNGKQYKSYVHVSDCVNAMIEIPKKDKNKSVEVYNIATWDGKTVTELADIMMDELKLNPKYKYTGGDRGWVGDVPVVDLSIDKAIKTGWEPKLDSERAIRRAVKELKEKSKVRRKV